MHRVVCLFTPQLSLVLINRPQEGWHAELALVQVHSSHGRELNPRPRDRKSKLYHWSLVEKLKDKGQMIFCFKSSFRYFSEVTTKRLLCIGWQSDSVSSIKYLYWHNNALHTVQLYYLADLIDLHRPSRCLRSTTCHVLAVPPCAKSFLPVRLFVYLHLMIGILSLCRLHIRSSDSFATFKSHLKSHLLSSSEW